MEEGPWQAEGGWIVGRGTVLQNVSNPESYPVSWAQRWAPQSITSCLGRFGCPIGLASPSKLPSVPFETSPEKHQREAAPSLQLWVNPVAGVSGTCIHFSNLERERARARVKGGGSGREKRKPDRTTEIKRETDTDLRKSKGQG